MFDPVNDPVNLSSCTYIAL